MNPRCNCTKAIAARAQLYLALVASAIAVASCAGDSATGPTALFNATLGERFESEISTSQPLHGGQLLEIIERLASGAPVGGGRLVIDGKAAPFSFVAEYDVRLPFVGVPDSSLTIFAWSGRDADTIVEFQSIANDGVIVLMTDPTTLDLSADPPLWGVKASRPGRKCGGFLSTAPPGIPTVPSTSCRIETVSTSLTAVLGGADQPTVSLVLPVQPIVAIREEFLQR
jgi:hypothetical protein